MNKFYCLYPVLGACCLGSTAVRADAGEEKRLQTVVVTAPATVEPLMVRTDPKAPRQPIPANDGADFLKSIPGFSVIRKGGTDGDPVFRGMSGSRLGIFLDGQEIYGGCGGRMDPPTAYIYPESYDRVTVLKGPQSVMYGAGASAGVVLFERDIRRFSAPGLLFNGSLTFGSFGRSDQLADLRIGNEDFYVQAAGSYAHSDHYKDGSGNKVHSRYTRWNTNAAVGWTPDENTLLELSAVRSDGKAAYADRGMDGAKFARENIALKFEKRALSPLVDKVWIQTYYNHIDHVMDNFTLRDQLVENGFSASNPDRRVAGARAGVTLTPSEPLSVSLGVDVKRDVHRARAARMQASAWDAKHGYRSQPYNEDMRFRQFGVFTETSYWFDDGGKIIGGLRIDRHSARDRRACIGGMAVNGACMNAPANATFGKRDRDTLPSGFLRYEGVFAEGAGNYYAGIGHAARFPDYWERLLRNGETQNSAFLSLKPEKNTQLDVGMGWDEGEWAGSLSGFYGKVRDYILLTWSPSSHVRNVDATTMGLEGDVVWRFARNWQTSATLAYVRGKNDSDDKALAQQPPLEARLAFDYDDGRFSWGSLLRLVARQTRYDIGSGSIVSNGQDLGPSSGFAVFSMNAGWRPSKDVLIGVGVDNLFDRTYAEHLSRNGASLPGFIVPADTRINEPGRTFWIKAQLALK